MAVRSWLERNDFAGWDPFDLLNSPFLQQIGARNRLAGIALVQLGKRSPVNLRRALRVPRLQNPKGIGLALQAYLWLRESAGDSAYDETIKRLATLLVRTISPGYAGAAWGYPFDWPNRSFVAPRGTPSVVATYFCASALLNLSLQDTSFATERSLGFDPAHIARSACDFVVHDLKRIGDKEEQGYFSWSYTPLDHRQIHNASLFGARLLAEVATVTGEPMLAQLARSSAHYTASRQRSDGSWPYGEDRRNSWVDNFHTAYVVSSLLALSESLQDGELFDVAVKGYNFWTNNFISVDCVPKPSPDRMYPIDIHNSAQAIITFLDFSRHDPGAVAKALRVATWTLDHMAQPDGAFAYQRRRWFTVSIPYARWSDAWMFNALSALWSQLNASARATRPPRDVAP